MINSMTGFGRGSAKIQKGKITAEIKTVNHKFFDATIKLPNGMLAFEDRIKEILQKRIARGKIYFNLILEGCAASADKIIINKSVAKNYVEEMHRLKKDLNLSDEISIKDLLMLPGVVTQVASGDSETILWPALKKALDNAIKHLIDARKKEGQALYRDLDKRSRNITSLLTAIKSRAHININEYRKKFSDRVKDITGGGKMDVGRLEMEVAIFAKNCDISEEITRLANHLENFNKTISFNGEIGKKLDFIAQEMHREINTIGSKASDFKIAKSVIEIKGEIEKIREQAKNLE